MTANRLRRWKRWVLRFVVPRRYARLMVALARLTAYYERKGALQQAERIVRTEQLHVLMEELWADPRGET